MLFPMRIASLFYNITHHYEVVRLHEGEGGRGRGKEEGFEQDDERK